MTPLPLGANDAYRCGRCFSEAPPTPLPPAVGAGVQLLALSSAAAAAGRRPPPRAGYTKIGAGFWVRITQ